MSGPLSRLYGDSLSLLTDLYQLTMAYGYFKSGMSGCDAVFNLFFRKAPFKGGYAIACGLHYVVELLESWSVADEELTYLSTLTGNDGEPLFDEAFLTHLSKMRLSLDVDAIPEGSVAFPHEPLVRLRGPIEQCQILETPLLNIVNFQTLIATKSSRVCAAALGEPVLEFGLRRAQGIDGAMAASRAAYVGGCAATSNVLAGKVFGIPVKGTHAHAWIMAFDTELEAFEAYAEAMPNNCVFLVDTYDTLRGVERAVEVGKALRARGHEMVGIRLDSGDLAELSIAARQILDAGGFPDATIVASNDLDEHKIAALKARGATIAVWGVGTHLTTARDQPALGGVYKLSAIREPGGEWEPRLKLSETPIKVSNPGIQQVRRYRDPAGTPVADLIYDERTPPPAEAVLVDVMDPSARRRLGPELTSEDLLVPVFRGGERVYDPPPLDRVRARALSELASFDPAVRALTSPAPYPAGLDLQLYEIKDALMTRAAASGEQG